MLTFNNCMRKTMISDFNRMMALDKALETDDIKVIQKLQENCRHSILIHFGQDTLPRYHKKMTVTSNLYCPHCGKRALKFEYNESGYSIIIDASNFTTGNVPYKNLQAFLTKFKAEYKKSTRILPEQLSRVLKKTCCHGTVVTA